MSAVVELKDVTRRYGPTVAVDDVSLNIEQGTIRGLLGPNGAGKTTILRLIAGLVAPSSGKVTVLDGDPSSSSVRQRIGWVPAVDRSFYMRISGLENLLFFARQYGLGRSRSMARAKELIEFVGLADAADTVVSGYSHGMTRKLGVARALLMPTELLLVDEATHDLDLEGSRTVRQMFRQLADDGATVVWSTHRLDELPGLVNDVTVMDRGTVRFDGPLDKMLELADRPIYNITLLDNRRVDIAASVSTALGSAASLVGTNGTSLSIRLAPETILGAALKRLIDAGFEVLDCHQATGIVERAVESRLRG